MQPSCTNSLCTRPWLSKNTISIVFSFDFWKRSFFGRGKCSPTHSELWRFVSGSYAKHQLSSPVITLSRKFLSPLVMFNSLGTRQIARPFALLPVHSFRFFKPSLKIRGSRVFGMPSVSAINREVTFRSSLTILSTAAMLSLVRIVVGRPLRSSSFADSLPSRNRLCHSKIVVRLNAASL